jgi:hypothetical protein
VTKNQWRYEKIHQSKTNKYDTRIDALKVRKRIEYDGCVWVIDFSQL